MRVRTAGLLDRRTGWYRGLVGVLTAMLAATGGAFAVLGGSWWQLVVAGALGLLFTQFAFLSHEAAHRQVFASHDWNDRAARYVGTFLTGISYAWWTNKHTRHHANPNTVGKDPDISFDAISFRPEDAARRTGFLRVLVRVQGYAFFPMLLVEGVNLHWQSIRTCTSHGTVKHRWAEGSVFAGRFVRYVGAVFWLLPLGIAFAFLGVQLAVSGFCMGIAFAPNHKGMPIIEPGQRADFFSRQVLTSRDVSGGRWVEFFTGGLKHQVEHHLFPSMADPGATGHDGRVDDDVRARSVLGAVLRDLGASWSDVEPLTGGSVNHTVRVRRSAGADVVVRIPVDPLRVDEYPVEDWASAAAERAGIAVARVLRHGRHGGTPFLVAEYVEPDPRPITEPWRQLGAAARAIGTIALVGAPPSLYSRFGTDPASAWRAHVAYNVRSLDGADPLLQAGAHTSASSLREVFEPLGARAFEHGLAHGDLAPRNLLSRGPDAAPVVIDWGAAEVGPTPWTDARRVYAWTHLDGEVSASEFDAFTAAAGLDGPGDQRTLRAMTALHLVDVTRWARERRPDRYREYVEACRRGLRRLGLSD